MALEPTAGATYPERMRTTVARLAALLLAASAPASALDPLDAGYDRARLVAAQAPGTSVCLEPEFAGMARVRLAARIQPIQGGAAETTTLAYAGREGSEEHCRWTFLSPAGNFELSMVTTSGSVEVARTSAYGLGVLFVEFGLYRRDPATRKRGQTLFYGDGISHHGLVDPQNSRLHRNGIRLQYPPLLPSNEPGGKPLQVPAHDILIYRLP